MKTFMYQHDIICLKIIIPILLFIHDSTFKDVWVTVKLKLQKSQKRILLVS